VEVARAWPLGGGYRFRPGLRDGEADNPRDPEHDGTGADLRWRGEVVARGAPDGATYCCGLTLALLWRVLGDAVDDLDDAPGLLASWFCPTIGHGGVVEALVARGLGTEVEPNLAVPGDFCQFWRSTSADAPSGHSVLFLGWTDSGELRYWSSQAATHGVGVREEAPGPEWVLRFVRFGV
jgi:hypothetical protein